MLRNLALVAAVLISLLMLPYVLAFWTIFFAARWHHAAGNRAARTAALRA